MFDILTYQYEIKYIGIFFFYSKGQVTLSSFLQSIYASSSDDDKTNNRSLGEKNERIEKLPIKQKKDIDWLNRQIFFSRTANGWKLFMIIQKKDIILSSTFQLSFKHIHVLY